MISGPSTALSAPSFLLSYLQKPTISTAASGLGSKSSSSSISISMNVILILISKHGYKDCRDRTKGGWDNVILQVELEKEERS